MSRLRVAVLLAVVLASGRLLAVEPPPRSSLLISVDLPCEVSVDGSPAKPVEPGKPVKLPIGPGQHLVTATCDGENWEKVVDVIPEQQQVVAIRLNQERQARAAQAADLDTALVAVAQGFSDIAGLLERDCADNAASQNAHRQEYERQRKQQKEQEVAEGLNALSAALSGKDAPSPNWGPSLTFTPLPYTSGPARQQADALATRLLEDLSRLQTDDPLRKSLRDDLTAWVRAFQARAATQACLISFVVRAFPNVRRLPEMLELPAFKETLSPQAWTFWERRREFQNSQANP